MKRLVLGVMALSLVTACAGPTRETYLQERAGEFMFNKPLKEVWPHVKAILKEDGFNWQDNPSQAFIRTEFKEDTGSSAMSTSSTRYSVEGYAIDAGHSRIRFMRNSVAASGSSGMADPRAQATAYAGANASGRNAGLASAARDLKMEWRVIQRASPEQAAELEAEADAKFKK